MTAGRRFKRLSYHWVIVPRIVTMGISVKLSMSKTYVVLAYSILVVDAYLALAALATRAGVQNLPPFGIGRVSDSSRFYAMTVATWTAVLAFGCLRRASTDEEQPARIGLYWCILVLVLAWFAQLIPIVAKFFDYLWDVLM
jgi:hypothetical protein